MDEWVVCRLGFALALGLCVAGELPGATLGATVVAVPWEGMPLRGRVRWLRPGGLGRSGGGFRFALLAQRKRSAILADPLRALSARPSSAPNVAPRVAPGSSLDTGVGWKEERATLAVPRALCRSHPGEGIAHEDGFHP
ncbi:hypothetical protein J2T07_000948 [Luteibacter jiangsuensis]|uniref:Secreted protein n=1 Tax=Luteibacter jiangsuensis TaxID=637577 RepID=A0ABT9SUX5_9GAMM|nr:hypothetical protein [Luteibacter jiangsuensis]